MEELKISLITKALGLRRNIVGVRFLVFQKDYEDCAGLEDVDTCLCKMVSEAGDGKRMKARAQVLNCPEGAYAVGMLDVPEGVRSGRVDYSSGKYASYAVARQITASKQYITQKIYGIEISPLEVMGDADLAIVIGTAKDMMRIMQGYTHQYGVAKNVLTIGAGGVCSELISKPFVNNDVNVSLLSSGARERGAYSEREMGISMPIHMISNVMDAVLLTVNLTENNKPKMEILNRLNYPEELGFSIQMNYDYAIQGMEYQKHCEECKAYESDSQER